MGFYQSFTSSRTTDPDPVALRFSLRAIDPVANYISDGLQVYQVKKATVWTGPQIASAQNAIDTAPALTSQRQAQNEIDTWTIAQRALVLALIDQLNVIRSKLSPPLTDITPAQALAAVRTKAGTL